MYRVMEDIHVADMEKAIATKNLDSFDALLEQNLDLWTSRSSFFPESRRSKKLVCLLLRLTISGFHEALQLYMHRHWKRISVTEINEAMEWVLQNKRARASALVLLEGAFESAPPFLSSRQIFTYALEMHLFELAERVARLEAFQANRRCFFLYVGRHPCTHWEHPLHDTVAHNQLRIVELLLDRGADVDAISDFSFTPLIIACHCVSPDMVALLLQNGCDPNHPPICLPSSRTKLRQLMAKQGPATNISKHDNRSRSLTEMSGKIVHMLINVGLLASILEKN